MILWGVCGDCGRQVKRKEQSVICEKTGFHAYVEPYGCWVYGDAFQLSDCRLFRISAVSFSEPLSPTTNYTIHRVDQWFDQGKHNQGFVETLISTRSTYHSYEGISNDRVHP